MKIAVDTHGLQSEGSRNRGIGRYVQSLVQGLIANPGDVDYLLFANSSLPKPDLELRNESSLWTIPVDREASSAYNELLIKTAILSADVDAVFLPSPIETVGCVMPDFAGFPTSVYAVCYDLIPFIFADSYLTDPGVRSLYTHRLRNLRNADFIFAISESTRQDTIRYLGTAPERVLNIGAGVSPFFTPIPSSDQDNWLKYLADKFGVTKSFILYTGGEDWRKNIEGLVNAFSVLPPALKQEYQLVVACRMSKHGEDQLHRQARDLGLDSAALILTNFISDEELRALYSVCSLFVFPSFYEGFGLPLVEAMACGAPAITANNSSLVEIVSQPELLFDPRNPASMADRIQRVLENSDLRHRLATEAVSAVSKFRWDAVVQRVRCVLEAPPVPFRQTFDLARPRMDIGDQSKSESETQETIAFFSPFRPLQSGISDYSEEIIPSLAAYYDLDLCVDDGYSPQVALSGSQRFIRPVGFERDVYTRRRGYKTVLYQMGNSRFHAYMYSLLRRYAGITILHDYNLCGMINQAWQEQPQWGISLPTELTHSLGKTRAEEVLGSIEAGNLSVGDLPSQGIFGNRRIFTRSLGVIVHNQWSFDKAIEDSRDCGTPIALIPPVMPPAVLDGGPEQIRLLRRKWNIPEDAFVYASCGIVATTKRPYAVLDAFREQLAELPHAFLIFVGSVEMGPMNFEAEISRRGLTNHVRISGFVDVPTFNEYLCLSDVCVTLRYPSNGETSGALIRMLVHAKPSIVTDIGSFADFPDEVVHKLPTPDKGDEVGELRRAFHLMATNEEYRTGLGRRAVEYMHREHAPERCARLYADFIEQVMRDPRTRQRLLADRTGRELARAVPESREYSEALFAPFQAILDQPTSGRDAR